MFLRRNDRRFPGEAPCHAPARFSWRVAFLLWSGRMGCWKHGRRFWREAQAMGRWPHDERRGGSGNRAFDDYRQETLRRLEEEQRDFIAFLERLRLAKDKE